MNEKKRLWLIIGVIGIILIVYYFFLKLTNNNLLDVLFSPLLKLPAFVAILILSLFITLVMTFVYKWMTDQTLMKSLKEDQKKMQTEIKKHRDNPKKMMELQKKQMSSSMQYMTHSFKPTLVTFIPIIMIFAWMNANLAYAPIMPDNDFTITAHFQNPVGNVSLELPEGMTVVGDNNVIMLKENKWTLNGKEGKYDINISFGNEKYPKTVLVDSKKYFEPLKKYSSTNLEQVTVDYSKTKVFGDNFNIFGWHPGWLFLYIMSSLLFSVLLRKAMKIY